MQSNQNSTQLGVGLTRLPILIVDVRAISVLAIYVTLLAGRRDLFGVELRWPLFSFAMILLLAQLKSLATSQIPPAVFGTVSRISLFLGLLILSSMWAHSNARIAQLIADLIFMMVLTVLLSIVLSHADFRLPFFILHLSASAGYIYLLFAFVQYDDSGSRLAALGGGPNVFVRVLFTALLAIVYLNVKIRPLVRLLACIPLAIGMLLSGSRGGIISAGLVLLWMAGKELSGGKLRVASISVAALGLVFIALQFLPTSTLSKLDRRYIQLTIEDRYTSSRDALAVTALRLFGMNPVAGNGLDSFFSIGNSIEGLSSSHSIVLTVLADSGLLGGVLLLSVLSRLLGAIIKIDKRRNIEKFFAANVLFYVFACNFSGEYYDWRYIWIFGVSLVVSQAQSRKLERQ